MIPTTADDETLERYVANIIATWHAASALDHTQGRAWYPVANQLAEVLGDGDVRLGAGLLAALSQTLPWERNMELAREIAATGVLHGHTGEVLRKVARIMGGEDPLLVLPQDAKTGHFYRNIFDPSDPDPVTVDRHMHDLIVGERYLGRDRGLSSRTRYATLAHTVRVAGRRLGEIPAVIQPVGWLYWRRTYGRNGTR